MDKGLNNKITPSPQPSPEGRGSDLLDKGYYTFNGIDVSECENVSKQSVYGGGPGCRNWGNKPCMLRLGCDYKKRIQAEYKVKKLEEVVSQIYELIRGLSFYRKKTDLCEVLVKIYAVLNGGDTEGCENGIPKK